MAEEEDKDSKSEEPTEKKLQDAFEKGNVPFAREVVNAASLFAMLLIIYFQVPAFFRDTLKLLRSMFANISEWPLETGGEASNLFYAVVSEVALGLAPIIGVLMILGLSGALFQNQPRLVLYRIQPKMQNISLMKGLKKLFGAHGLREFIKSLFKFTAAAVVGTLVVIATDDWVLSHIFIDPGHLPESLHTIVLQISFGLFLTMIGLGALDLVMSRSEWYGNQKMSLKEIKDEQKQSEGDPIVKQKSRSLAKDRARRRMIAQVDQASVVITNPTHYAVALRYNPEVDRAPMVLAKGQDLIALKIRERAEECGIPIVEDKPLARSLFAIAKVDMEIPVEFYVPIAKIVRILSDKEKRMLH